MTDSMLDIPGYNLLRRDRNDDRVDGGLLAYVHPGLDCRVWTNLHEDHLETVVYSAFTPNA